MPKSVRRRVIMPLLDKDLVIRLCSIKEQTRSFGTQAKKKIIISRRHEKLAGHSVHISKTDVEINKFLRARNRRAFSGSACPLAFDRKRRHCTLIKKDLTA